MPKSSSFTPPSAVTRMLLGLMSRWMTRWRCACATAASTSRNSAIALVDAEPRANRSGVDALAFDQLEHQVGLAAGGHAGIEQARDVRVREAGEDRAFALEAARAGAADQRQDGAA